MDAYSTGVRMLGVPAASFLEYGFPFLDWHSVLSAIECKRLGYDVIATNPCDVLGRPLVYSPAWLYAAVLPIDKSWTKPTGMFLDLAFLASLFLLPVARDWRSCLVLSLAMVSSTVVFALERTNTDIVIFVMIAIALHLGGKGRAARVIGYGTVLFAGILKFYPLVALVLVLRERLAVCLIIAATAAATVIAYLAVDGTDVLRAIRIIPSGTCVTDAFGARNMPRCISRTLDVLGVHWTYLPYLLQIGLTCLSGLAGIWITRTTDLAARLALLTNREKEFLLAGAILVVGCFFTAYNLYYRAVFLLLMVPGLLRLLGRPDGLRDSSVYGIGLAVVLLLLWSEALHLPLHALSPVLDGLFSVARECVWWWFIGFLFAIIIAVIRSLPTWTELHALIGRQTIGRGGM